MKHENLVYKYGFFAHREGIELDHRGLLTGWENLNLGKSVVHIHPDAEHFLVEGAARTLLVIGTMYAVGKRSREACIDDLANLPAGTTSDFLNEVSGRFALFVLEQNGDCNIYHDAFGARSIFYVEDQPGFAASHAGLLGNILQLDKNPEVARFMETKAYQARVVKYLPGDLTVWQGVYALIPNNSLNLASASRTRYWPVAQRQPGNFDTFFQVFDEHIQGLTDALRGKSVLVGITGGIDTRAVFGAFHRYGLPFTGVTWMGGYIEEKELTSVTEIVELMAIPHSRLWPDAKHDETVADIATENSGGYRKPSKLSARMYDVYHGKDVVMVRGYGGEILRGFYNVWAKPMLDLSARTMMAAYGSSATASAEDKAFLVAAFEGLRQRANYEGLEAFGYDPADIYYWEHRMGCWGSAMLNEGDVAVYTLVGMNGRKLYEAGLALEKTERLTKGLLAKVTARYNEDLANVKYF